MELILLIPAFIVIVALSLTSKQIIKTIKEWVENDD